MNLRNAFIVKLAALLVGLRMASARYLATLTCENTAGVSLKTQEHSVTRIYPCAHFNSGLCTTVFRRRASNFPTWFRFVSAYMTGINCEPGGTVSLCYWHRGLRRYVHTDTCAQNFEGIVMIVSDRQRRRLGEEEEEEESFDEKTVEIDGEQWTLFGDGDDGDDDGDDEEED